MASYITKCRIHLDPVVNKDGHPQTPSTIASSIAHAQETIDEPDGFIFLSTEHNGCIPPSLSTVLYQLEKAYFCHKPSAIVVYSEGTFKHIGLALNPRYVIQGRIQDFWIGGSN